MLGEVFILEFIFVLVCALLLIVVGLVLVLALVGLVVDKVDFCISFRINSVKESALITPVLEQ